VRRGVVMETRRIHYIDWLRVLAVLLLFPFHTMRVYNHEPFYVKGSHLSFAFDYLIAFIDKWHMPLLFLLAGASTYLAMAKRTTGRYAWERVLRLGVPLVFGFFVLIPPQTWYGARFNAGYTGSFWQYISSGQIFVWNIQNGGDYYGGFGIGQLWFILYLLVISILVLPVIAFAHTERGQAFTKRLASGLTKPYWWFVPALLLWITEGLPDPADKHFFMYLTYFLLGFIVISNDVFAQASERQRWWTFLTGMAICAVYAAAGPWRDTLPDPSWPLAGANIAGMLGAWLVLVGALGMGRRYLNRPSPALSYQAESSYPIYLLHQTAIVVIAFYLVQASIWWLLQWSVLLATAVVVSFALYEIVRRVGWLRFCFGMRAKRPTVVTEVAPETA
jgi:glucan biosynthesis protein C